MRPRSRSPRLLARRLCALALAALAPAAPARAQGFELAFEQALGGRLLAPVVLAGGALLVAERQGRVWTLDPADGRPLARRDARGELAGLLAAGSLGLLLEADATLRLVDAALQDAGPTACLPAALAVAPAVVAGILVVALEDASVLAMDPASLRPLWRVSLQSPASLAPLELHDAVLLASRSGALARLRPSDGRTLSRARAPGEVISGLGGLADLLLVGSPGQRLVALDARDLRQRWRAEVGRGPSTGIAAAGALALVATEANQLVALRRNGQPAWRASLPARVLLEPVAWDEDCLVVPHRLGQLLSFDRTQGYRRRELTLGNPVERIVSRPLLAGDLAILATSEGRILGLRRAAGALAPPPHPRQRALPARR